ncbi:MAG: tetratricopeptide repeat protein [Gemmatimonadetes bacterium]|nr:tetratricopeptide repeat protein [Gemmatimonadota bacterium]
MSPARRRNVDAAERATLARVIVLSLAGGALGAVAGGLLYGLAGFFLGAIIGWLFSFLVVRALMAGAGAAAGTIYAPSGDSTPHKREYSLPQSLALRGRYEEAIRAYQDCCAEFPDDPEPYIRIARLYREELGRPEDAVSWFKKARAEARLQPELEALVTQEIIEAFTYKLAAPRRAMPELARLAERFPGTREGNWAAQRLRELKEEMARGETG